MTQGNTPGETSGKNPLLDEQLRIQLEVETLAEDGKLAEATDLLFRAGSYRDAVVASKESDAWSVEASINFNETLYFLLDSMAAAGGVSAFESLFGSRLRSTTNPYEASALYYWIGLYEARSGNFQSAESHVRAAEEVAEAIGSPWLVTQAQNMLSRIYEDLGDETSARIALAGALDSLEKGESSDLYIPDKYKYKALYGLGHRLRFYLGKRLYHGRERDARYFCNEVLTATGHPNRRGFLHHWMGQAELLHVTPNRPGSRFGDTTKATLHLKNAEDYFVAAGEPVYAAAVVLDQAWLYSRADRHQALARAEPYLIAAVDQSERHSVYELALEVNDIAQQYQKAAIRSTVSYN